MTNNRSVAIIGSTGKAGKHLVSTAIEQGYHVKILLRNPDKNKFSHDNLEIVVGDAQSRESLEKLTENVDIIINSVGQNPKDAPFYSSITRDLIDIAEKKNIKRLVCVTGAVVTTPSDKKDFVAKLGVFVMKFIYSKMVADKQKEFSALSNSNLDWTLVRLPMISHDKGTGKIKESLKTTPGVQITNEDIADSIIEMITKDRYIHQAPFISN